MKLSQRSLPAFFLVTAAAFLMLSGSLHAQLTRGFISGTVTDTSGALVPGAQVSVTNVATNIERQTTTNDAGVYRFVAVEPGNYSVEFKLAGFQSYRASGITVGPTQEVVLNHALVVGAESTTVEVMAAPAGVELAKATPTIDRTLSGRLVAELPIISNGGTFRDVTRLALLAPTVNRAPGSNEFAANGQRARNNNFILDGTDNNDLSVTLANARVVPEGVGEFQVQTNSYSAEFGRNSGAQVSIVTKSGTNDMHGEVWDFYRGNWLEPVSLQNRRAGLKETPRFVHNQAGVDFGGPIIKDRTFFFGLLEANRRREAPDARNADTPSIPTPAGYAALQTIPLAAGQTAKSRQDVLNALRFLPDVHKLITNYANLTTQTVNGVPIQIGTARIPLANPHNFWFITSKLDHKLTENDTLSYRFLLDKRDQPDVVSNLQFGSRWSGAQTILGQNHAASYTRNFGPRLINEFRFGYIRRNLDFPENDPTTPTTIISGAFTIGGTNAFPQSRISDTFQWQDVATYLMGRHSLKMGVDIHYNKLFNRAGFDSKGTWRFNSLADFINNQAFSLDQAVNEATFDARQTNQNYFFQDDFKVTPQLTLNFGIRYEYSDVPFGFFGAATDAIAAVGVPRDVQPDKNNWAPRVGFAYSPNASGGWMQNLFGNGETVIRGGFGMGYDVLFYNILTNTASNYPRVVNSQILQPVTINLFPTLAPKIATIPPLNPLLTFVNSPSDSQNPTVHFWSLSVQRQFKTDYILELGYTGNRSYHGVRQGQTNPGILTKQQADTVVASRNANSIPGAQQRRLNPNWGSRVTLETTALGEYHAMFLRFDKKLSNGLLVGANYTWSANFSDNDESLGVSAITNATPQIPQNYFDYRNDWSRSIFDRPHRVVVHYSYELPWLRADAANAGALKHIFKGWQIAGYTEWQSGQPFTIRTGVDSGGSGTATPWRPNYNPNGTLIPDPASGDLRTFVTPINGTGVFVSPLTAGGLPLANSMYLGGNVGRNTLRGPAYHNWNFSLLKTMRVTERVGVQLRSDFTNLWNHKNFQPPVNNMSSPAFGTNTADLLTDSRQIQLSLKVKF